MDERITERYAGIEHGTRSANKTIVLHRTSRFNGSHQTRVPNFFQLSTLPLGYASTTPTLCSVSRGDFIGVSNFLQIIANRRLTGGSKQKSDKRDATSVASALSKRCDFWETNLGLLGIRNERNEERKM